MDTYVVTPRILQDTRLVPVLLHDYFLIPAGSGIFQLNLVEIPVDKLIAPPSLTATIVVRQVDAVTHVAPNTGAIFNKVSSDTPGQTQFHTNDLTFLEGAIYLNHADAGKTLEITYYGRGSAILISDINTLGGGGTGGVQAALPLVGGTMLGAIDMQLNNIIWKSPAGARYKISVTDDGVMDISPV